MFHYISHYNCLCSTSMPLVRYNYNSDKKMFKVIHYITATDHEIFITQPFALGLDNDLYHALVGL